MLKFPLVSRQWGAFVIRLLFSAILVITSLHFTWCPSRDTSRLLCHSISSRFFLFNASFRIACFISFRFFNSSNLKLPLQLLQSFKS
jgi:hypothetical protein